VNLNKLKGVKHTSASPEYNRKYDFSLENHAQRSSSAEVEVLFDCLSERLIKLIGEYEVAVGCVAWLTNHDILKALGNCDWVNLVVQKEDFLRNDTAENQETWVSELQQAYFNCGKNRKEWSENVPSRHNDYHHFNHTVQSCCVPPSGEWTHSGCNIRCLGYSGDKDRKTTPKMHHKFLVLGYADDDLDIIPEVVWTGSFNFTSNGEKSRENAVIIKDENIVQAYLSEWAQIWAMSEELNWKSKTPVEAQVYMGT